MGEPTKMLVRRMCHLRSADLQPQGLIKLQFRDQHRYFLGDAPNSPERALVPHTLLAAIPNRHFTNRYAQVIISGPCSTLGWPPSGPLPEYLVRWRYSPTRWLLTPLSRTAADAVAGAGCGAKRPDRHTAAGRQLGRPASWAAHWPAFAFCARTSLPAGAILKNHNRLHCDGSAHLNQRQVKATLTNWPPSAVVHSAQSRPRVDGARA